MRNLIFILILFIPKILNAQDEGGFGVIIEKVDSFIVEKVKVVNFGKYNGYIFPKEYGDGYFRKKMECIDLDTSFIRIIDKELVTQYFEANKRFMENRFQEMFDMKETNPDAYEWRKLRKDERRYWENFNRNKQVWIDKVRYSQRQYLGYINEKREKMVLIQLVDFREDPYGLKKYIDKQFISGWHDWFYSNISRMHYHLDDGELTVNEDF